MKKKQQFLALKYQLKKGNCRGILYFNSLWNGKGVKNDRNEAMKYIKMAIKEGDAFAMSVYVSFNEEFPDEMNSNYFKLFECSSIMYLRYI